jgi:hypothetical protein
VYYKNRPLVSQNTLHLKSGENLEITAGIGAYNSIVKPQIIIDNQRFAIDEATGRAYCSFKVNDAIGKHFKVVNIEYTEQDGKKETLQTKVEYTIDQ